MDEKKSLLIIDDDESSLKTLLLIFTKKGFEVEGAATGTEALEKAQERFFNVAFLDIKLPDMEGVDLLGPLKEMHPEMVVIMVTAYASMETVMQALNEGASAYITKPFNIDEVLVKVGDVLEKQRLVLENKRLYEEAQREVAERRKAEEVLRQKTHALGERVKELKCLYRISDLVEKPGVSLEEILQGTINLIPPAWQYPEVTCARLNLEGQDYRTQNFSETRWKKTSDIFVDGKPIGTLEVGYLEEKPEADDGPFLNEERYLIKEIAERLGHIAERKSVDEALRESEERFRNITDAAQDAIVILDNQGNISFWNRSAENIFGYKREEVLGKNLHKVIVPENFHESAYEGLKKFQGTGQGPVIGKTLELSAVKKGGKEFPVEISVSSVKIRGAWNAIGVARDISERKSAQEKIEAAHRELERKNIQLNQAIEQANQMAMEAESANRAKSEFLANMSHEIRTPMNGIIGMTELALTTDLTNEQREYLGMVKTSAESLLILINDILDFSKIEARQLELEEMDFDLRTALENAADILAVRAHYKGLELTFHIKPDVPTALSGDPARLRQIIVNLAGNAIKFTEKGEVVIRVGMEKEEEASVVLHCTVSDTGIGIPADKLEDIFESFSQVDSSNTRKYEGTGLGLTISKQIVEMMGGRIWVESEPAKGSSFHFTARFTVSRAEKRERGLLTERDLSSMRVLIVDDNATNRLVLREMASSWGLLPEEAPDGEAGLVKMNNAIKSGKPYRLLLLDLQMPGFSGFEVAKRVKEGSYGQNLRIILLSSVGQKGDAARCKEVGISGYLLKPVKQSELLDAILMAIGHGPGEKDSIITRYTIQEARGRLNILLAEDNLVNQKLAVKMLEKRGHRVVVVSNGREAVETIDKERFDLLLTDVQMPEMDGFEATRRIRERELKAQTTTATEHVVSTNERSTRSERIPIVAMTAHAMKGDREKCLAAGMDDYVSKPVKPQELFAVIEKLGHRLPDNKDEELSSSNNMSSTDVFNLSAALEIVDGDIELFKEIANLFLESLPDYIARIQKAIADNDSDATEQAAHGLKGSVGNFGAKQAFEAAYGLEVMGKEGRLAKAEEALQNLEKELKALEAAIKGALSAFAEDHGLARG